MVIKSLQFNVDVPLKMETEIEFNQLSLFVGVNGSGKTFVLINCFCLATLSHMISVKNADILTDIAQFVYDNSFSDQNINGIIKCIFGDDSTLSLEFKEGKVISMKSSGLEGKKITPVKYLSSQMRTFDNISTYLKIRKQLKITDPELIVAEMIKYYKLYDVLYLEGLITKCPIEIPNQVKSSLKTHFDFEDDIIKFDINSEKDEFHLELSDGSKKKMTSYGKGHQSIINMTIGQL